ncbi:MAG: HEAT repeat domain-containing protein [Pseudomonadota bacterium]|nr:HEAT repeat domain-containing protein [Pseudomonadota bacterium]
MPFVRKTLQAPPGKPATPQDILAGLASPSEEQRWTAARAASGSATFSRPLADALQAETVPRVREALLTSLVRIGNAESVAAMLPLLRSDDATLRVAALDALRLMVRGSGALLRDLLHDADVDVRVLSCELARELAGATATQLLDELLQSEEDPNVCAAAVEVLAEVGGREALPALEACASRFSDTPFLAFAIRVASDRIRAGRTHTGG